MAVSLVALRVLRRFSYTEPDPDAQYLKLLSAYGIADWSEPFFNNRALFSDYYLSERLKETPEWNESATTAHALQVFRTLMANVRQRVSRQDEVTTHAVLLEPALQALGFTLAVPAQRTAKAQTAALDYVLYSPDGAGRALAYCNTYTWDRNLDGPDEQRDPATPNENPGAQVVSLFDEDDSAGADNRAPSWAIVTNGKLWRLYARRAASRASNYYEIDLEEAVNSLDPSLAFRYFWLFFRAQAFLPAEGEGACFLDRLVDESVLYARQLGERLKDRVFEEIFPQFAEGFIANMRVQGKDDAWLRDPAGANGDGNASPLQDVFHGTLTFLYRLLFLLYAESRDLLPARELRGYYDISLQCIKQEVAGHAGDIIDERADKLKKAYSASATGLYDRLARLFGVIDKGEPSLNVPPYNGGLFTAETSGVSGDPGGLSARFLAEHKIPDRYLALGLDLMARDIDDKTQALAFIDYKSLGVRQLGSIYEGLLEFKLRIAAHKMAVVRGKKADQVVSYKDAVNEGLRVKAELPKGAVYLENDKRERKASGSYYTPDYIVKYIVQHTVGPMLQEKFEALRPRLREAEKGYFNYEKLVAARQRALGSGAKPEGAVTFWNTEDMQKLAQDVLDVKVLDPAMGSGHFLVEAVDFVSDRLIDFLNAFPRNPVTAALRRSRQAILARMNEQGVSIDPGRLTDVNLLRRQVLKRCVYGVDLNHSAVELAKVSLWLHCFTLGAPLSFLDHHLRWGNSLIGTTARAADGELQTMTNKKGGVNYTLFGGPFTGLLQSAEIMRGISALGDATLDEVRESASLFHQFEQAALPYKKLLDVFVIRHFGVKGADDFLRLYGADIMTVAQHKLGKDDQRVLAERERLYAQYRFFHWDLEFPEVFIDLEHADWKRNAGFDAVVGNPPYGAILEKPLLDRFFVESSQNGDVYVAFIEQGIKVDSSTGCVGYIVPVTWQTGVNFTAIRKLVLTTEVQRIINLPFDTFPDAYVDAGILIFCKRQPQNTWLVKTFTFPKTGAVHSLDNLSYQGTVQSDWQSGRGIVMLDPVKFILTRKLENVTRTQLLGSLTESVRGVLVADGSDIAETPRGKNWQPFFKGEFDRYEIDPPNWYVRFGDNLKERPASAD